MAPRLRRPSAALLAALLLASCGEEKIERYRVPKAANPAPAPAVAGGPNQPARDEPVRLLGAIAEHGGASWFFKITGPPEAIAAEKGRLDAFLRSLVFSGPLERPVAWTLPSGWEEAPARDQRYATIRPAATSGVELTVTAFPGEAGGILANVNRWRGQVGLRPLAEEELAAGAAIVEAGGKRLTVVDLTGARKGGGGPGGGSAPFAALGGGTAPHPAGGGGHPPVPGHPAGPPADAPSFDGPAGWRAIPTQGARAAAFEIGEGEGKAVVTVIPMDGDAGGLHGVWNMWRGQAGLEPSDPASFEKERREIETAAGKAAYFDLPGREARVLGAALPHGGRTWFLKMTGPPAIVAAERERFEAFVRSFSFSPREAE